MKALSVRKRKEDAPSAFAGVSVMSAGKFSIVFIPMTTSSRRSMIK